MKPSSDSVGELPTASGPCARTLLPGLLKPQSKQRVMDALVALSLANLCFVSGWFPPLYDVDLGYFNKLPLMPPALLALIINILGFALLVWLAIRTLRRWQNRWLHLGCGLLFWALLLLPLDFCRLNLLHLPTHVVFRFLRQPLVVAALVAILPVLVWQHRRTTRALAVALAITSPLAMLTLARIALLLLGLEHVAQHGSEPVLPAPGAVRSGQPRVVWLIFDETDQRLAFDQRPGNLRLPEFDRLRNECLVATNAYPPGDGTMISMPALISGRPLSGVAIKNASDLTLTLTDTGQTAAWSELPSVFRSARELGVNTALVGWFHPYARVLSRDLNYCAWYPMPMYEPARAATFRASLLRELGCLTGRVHERQLYIELCRHSLDESLSLVTNSTYGLVLLHLPPPHTPGIYIPDKDRLSIWGLPKLVGYFNNLELADHWLGALRRAMETSGQWDRTWLLLSADHSWRASAEYDGKRDLRVPFLFKTPGEIHPLLYSPRMNTLLTHDLLLAILEGEVTNQQSAVPWLEAHRSARPTLRREQPDH